MRVNTDEQNVFLLFSIYETSKYTFCVQISDLKSAIAFQISLFV